MHQVLFLSNNGNGNDILILIQKWTDEDKTSSGLGMLNLGQHTCKQGSPRIRSEHGFGGQ